MRSRAIRLSRPRRFISDLMHFSQQVPTVPVQREIQLAKVVEARNALQNRPSWPAIFIKAYALVSMSTPVLRRAYLTLPWHHLREYSKIVASITVERDYQGEPCVFFGRISSADGMSLADIQTRIRQFTNDPVEKVKYFSKMLSFAKWPRVIRRTLMWPALNIPNTRPGKFGTFGISVYSSLGAESLHPLSPLTTTLNYGIIGADGKVCVRIIYDHRVTDGAAIARVLQQLEEVLNTTIVSELRDMATKDADILKLPEKKAVG